MNDVHVMGFHNRKEWNRPRIEPSQRKKQKGSLNCQKFKGGTSTEKGTQNFKKGDLQIG